MTESDPGRRGRAGRTSTAAVGPTVFLVRSVLRAGLLSSALLLPIQGLTAQQAPDEADAFRAWPVAEVSWKVTELAERGASLFGGFLGFGVTHRTALGGAGFQLSGSTSLDPGMERSRRRLDFGYAGLALQHLRPLGPDWAATGGLLLGAGHAKVRDREMGTELGADNLGILELHGAGVWRGASPVQLFVGGGYRLSVGVQDLPGVSSADLRGFTLTLGLRIAGG